MEQQVTLDLKWFYFNQNNSGGYFINNDVVCEDVFIQARNAEEALSKSEVIFEPYSEYCECCGHRWSSWIDDSDGKDEPERYGEKVKGMKKETFHTEYILHYFDGKVEKHSYL